MWTWHCHGADPAPRHARFLKCGRHLGWAYFIEKGVYQSPMICFRMLRSMRSAGGRDDPTSTIIGTGFLSESEPAGAGRQQLERALKINPNTQEARRRCQNWR